MRVARVTRPGGPEVIEVVKVPGVSSGGRPVVTVRVHASALNRADLLQRKGLYPAPPGAPPDVLGMEFAGEVIGRPGGGFTEGDRVFGIVGGGANADLLVTLPEHLARIPDNLSWEEAAAVPEAFITAQDALAQAGFRAGERVLVHAVGSGVGLAAIQLVRAMGGTAYGTARTADKIERARAYGLTDGVVPGADLAALAPAVREWTNGDGVDVVLDLVGGSYFAANIECVARQGRIMLIGLTAGRSAENVNLGAILNKRLTIRGTVLRSRSDAEKAAATAAFARDVVPLLEKGVVRPVIDRVFPLEHIVEAHRLMETNATFGKIVLSQH